MERSLTDAQIELYSRQILLREVGGIGQKKLLASSVFLAGSGATFEVVASYIAGAGVGRIDLLNRGHEGDAARSARDAAVDVSRPRAVPALAPFDERSPDAFLQLRSSPPARLDEYDVVVIDACDVSFVASVSGAPSIGAIQVEHDASGSITLLLLPALTGGCVCCVRAADAPERASSGHEERGARGDEELAGAVVALAVCRWIATSADDDEPIALRLDPGAPTWETVEVAFAGACARGCRS